VESPLNFSTHPPNERSVPDGTHCIQPIPATHATAGPDRPRCGDRAGVRRGRSPRPTGGWIEPRSVRRMAIRRLVLKCWKDGRWHAEVAGQGSQTACVRGADSNIGVSIVNIDG